MQNMLINDDRETLTREYIPQGHFEMNHKLVQSYAIAQARLDPNILQKANPNTLVPEYRGEGSKLTAAERN